MRRTMLQKIGGVSSIIPLANIIEYWNMNGNGDGYNGNDVGGVSVTYPSGFIDESADFTGASSAILTGSNASSVFSFGNGVTDVPFSISLWVNWSTISTCYLLNIFETGNAEYGILQQSNNIRFRLFSEGNGSVYKQTSKPTTFSTGVWYHICVTYSGSGFPKVYINSSVTSQSTTTVGTYVAMEHTGAQISIGNLGFNNSFRTQGAIDEVIIANIELSEGQVTALCNAGLASTPVIS